MNKLSARSHPKQVRTWPVRHHLTWWSNVSRSEAPLSQAPAPINTKERSNKKKGHRASSRLSGFYMFSSPSPACEARLGEGYAVRFAL